MPSWDYSELLLEAIKKIGGDQTAFAKLVSDDTQYEFNQSQISKLRGIQHRINNSNKLDALKAAIERVLAGKLAPTEKSKSDHHAKKSNAIDEPVKVEFWTDYPATYKRDFARATELSISGLDLRRLQGHLKDLRRVIRRKGNVRIIFLDPDYYELCRYGALQDWGKSDPELVAIYRDSIWTTYEMIRSRMRASMVVNKTKLGNKEKKKPSGTLEIRTLRYPLGFGIDSMTFDDPEEGAIYVRYYPMYPDTDDMPIVPLTTADSQWYSFYKEQFETHWNEAVPWTNDKERTWKDSVPKQGRSK